MTNFQMDADWLVFHPNPTVPAYQPPAGSVDAHCHVFGPGSKFPFADERKYTPCDADKSQLWALRDQMGFERRVIVQATCHGTDNSALVDALQDAGDRARGIASVKPDISHEELQTLHAAGVRGVRFNFVKRLVDTLPHENLERIAEKITALGWHCVIYFEAAELTEHRSFFESLPTTIVFDHKGRPDLSKPVDGPDFQAFVQLLADNENMWSKVTCPERISNTGPPTYDDFVPFAKTLVDTYPTRVLWGTDWPHPNLKSHMPDDATLVDMIPRIATTETLQKQLLVDNPMRLYWDAA